MTAVGQAPDTVPAAVSFHSPDSLLWRYMGDRRYNILGSAVALLEVMYPPIGAGVSEHSKFFEEPVARALRSHKVIIDTIYGENREEIAAWIRDMHKPVKGLDDRGKRYSALNPDTYYFAHAIFVWTLFRYIDLLERRKLTTAECEELYQETCEWFRVYGVSGRAMPADYPAFVEYFDQICREELRITDAVRRGTELFAAAGNMEQDLMPPLLWKALAPVTVGVLGFYAAGALPPVVRRKAKIPWNPVLGIGFKGACAAVKVIWPVLPARVRYWEEAYNGFERKGWPTA